MNKIILTTLLVFISIATGCKINSYSENCSNSLATGNQFQADVTSSSLKNKIFTEKDFNGFGFSDIPNNRSEFSFTVKIHADLPLYTFHVDDSHPNLGYQIEVFKITEAKPLQRLQINEPQGLLAISMPKFFNVADINFDGYADIGLPFEGGALWTAYKYWIFDKNTGLYITAPATDDFKNIRFGTYINFDKDNKIIITEGYSSASLGYRRTYEYKNKRIILWENMEEENINLRDGQPFTKNYDLACSTTITHYTDTKEISKKTKNNSCELFKIFH